MKRIGLFAGVFDPIHLGHTSFLRRAIEENRLDMVYVLVERAPKYKKCIAAYEHRKAMAKLAIEDIGNAEIYEPASDFFPITSSLPDIKRTNPGAEIFLLLGDDVAAHIDKWEAGDELKGVKLIVAERNARMPYSDVSSLKIRQKKQAGLEVELDPRVLAYCEENSLY